ncbi:hypothetical protein OAA19_02250 [Rubripirellula sp.]|nr:hypothetical protein [Rubripirellula sp.]
MPDGFAALSSSGEIFRFLANRTATEEQFSHGSTNVFRLLIHCLCTPSLVASQCLGCLIPSDLGRSVPFGRKWQRLSSYFFLHILAVACLAPQVFAQVNDADASGRSGNQPLPRSQETIGDGKLSLSNRENDPTNDPADEPNPRAANESMELVDQLSKDRHSIRQRATYQMWQQRNSIREFVQKAAGDDDAEVAARAGWILDQWRRGALPETPPEVARLLNASTPSLAMDALLEAGYFRAVIVAIEETQQKNESQAIRERIALTLERQFPVCVHQAIARGELRSFMKLLDLVANTLELAVCRYEMMRELEIEITADNLLPKASEDWSPLVRLRTECLLSYLEGDIEGAVTLAAKSIDPELLMNLRMMLGDWETLATELSLRARNAEAGSLESSRLWTLVLASSDRGLLANSPDWAVDLRAEAVRQLSESNVGETAEGKLSSAMRWKGLASHGELDRALDLMRDSNPSDAAALCKDSSRIQEAFGILGYPLDRLDIDLSVWVRDAIEDQRNASSPGIGSQMQRMLALMQCLISSGRDDLAFEIALELTTSDVKIQSLALREFVLSSLSMSKRTDWLISLAVPEGVSVLSPETCNTISRVLPECDLVTLDTTVQALLAFLPDRSLQERLLIAADLFRGEDVDGIDIDQILPKLFSYLVTPVTAQQLRSPLQAVQKSKRANLNFVRLFSLHGQTRLAQRCLEYLTRNGDLDAILMMADQQCDAGRGEDARALYQSVLDLLVSTSRERKRFSNSVDSSYAIRANVGLWRLARVMQDRETEAARYNEIRLSLCTPNLSHRNNLAEYLADHLEEPFALETFERLLPVVALGLRREVGLYDVARRYAPLAKSDTPGSAAKWFDLALNQTLWSVDFRSGAYVTLPMFVQRWALEQAILDGDVDQVSLRLKRMLRLDATDIDFAERLLPQMRANGMEVEADRALSEIIQRGLEHSQRFPFDAMTCNNIAWVAAMNRRHLPQALELSLIAVRAEPESAIYRDTLAEVLFLLGRRSEAISIEQGCLIDNPSDWHLHEQHQKYQQAESDSGNGPNADRL